MISAVTGDGIQQLAIDILKLLDELAVVEV
jgi:hypothetical protein